jgi:hypothetical protein
VLTSKLKFEDEFSTLSELTFSGKSSRKVGLGTKKKLNLGAWLINSQKLESQLPSPVFPKKWESDPQNL